MRGSSRAVEELLVALRESARLSGYSRLKGEFKLIRKRAGGLVDSIGFMPSWYAAHGYMDIGLATRVPIVCQFCYELTRDERLLNVGQYRVKLSSFPGATELTYYDELNGFRYTPDTTAEALASEVWGLYTTEADAELSGIIDAETLLVATRRLVGRISTVVLTACLCIGGELDEAARLARMALSDHTGAEQSGITPIYSGTSFAAYATEVIRLARGEREAPVLGGAPE